MVSFMDALEVAQPLGLAGGAAGRLGIDTERPRAVKCRLRVRPTVWDFK